MPAKTTFEQLLEARMQQLASRRREVAPAPTELKDEVFRTLDLLDTVGEIGSLFTGTLLGTAAEFIDLIENPEGEPPPASANPSGQ